MGRRKQELRYAPRKIFESILEYAVIPTFDLVIEYGDQGVIIVRRRIAPYRGKWALPGLRIMKGETIDDVLCRIAWQELGLRINPENRLFLGQETVKFRTEQERQDISTGYLIRLTAKQEIRLNREHFTGCRIVSEIPQNMGGIYKKFLEKYFVA
jgi:ADP-ribose pyrophosphatase YjhB (NUDIX family)